MSIPLTRRVCASRYPVARIRIAAVFSIFLLSVSAGAAEALSLDGAIDLALEQSPRLASPRANVLAQRARLEGASLLLQNNPEFAVAVGPRNRGSEPSTLELGVSLSQRFELFGQRGARKDAANAATEAAELRLQSARVVLAAEVRESFAGVLAAEEERALAEEAKELALKVLEAAKARLEAGAATRIELNSARVELGRATRQSTLAIRALAAARSELRLLLGMGANQPLELAGALIDSKAAAMAGPDAAALLARALEQRADLRAARAEAEAAGAISRLAARQVLPSPELGVNYSQEEGAQIVQGTLGFELPLFNRNIAERGVASAREMEAKQLLRAVEIQVYAEVELALKRYQTAQRAAQAFGADVVEALEQNVELIDEAYRAGKVDFFQLLVIRRETLEARLALIEALEELAIAEARLKRSIGSVR